MHHVGAPPGALHETVGEVARLVIEIPVIALGEDEALRRLQAEAMHFSEREEKRGDALLAALRDAELRRLLDGVRCIETGIGEANHLRARTLRLQDEG